MKYMGSKARFTKDIMPIILDGRLDNQWYVEPFAGGMNSICEVSGNRIANDIHKNLIEMWRKLIDGWIPEKVTKDHYNSIRNNQDVYSDAYVGWVGFNCSYSGKWFGGYAGETVTKIGTIRDYQTEAINNVSKQVKKMNGVVFRNQSYLDLEIPDHSIVYCDPPYQHTTEYANSFSHTRFWDWGRDLSSQGHSVFVSEYNAPNDFECIWSKKVKSSLSANGRGGSSKLSVERLFKIK